MSYDDALCSHVERSLHRDLGERPLGPDDDGDWLASHEGATCWVRILDGETPLVRVWALAAHGVKKSAKLLSELNEINQNVKMIRCLWSDGAVYVAGEMVLESVEPGDLGGLVAHVAETADRVGSLIAAVFGGERPATAPYDVEHEQAD